MKVLIIYRYLPHYRKRFYNNLRMLLLNNDIELDLIIGNNKINSDKDDFNKKWIKYIPNIKLKITNEIELIWQPMIRYINNYDLIIVEQANKLLLNYLLILLRKFKNFKLAFWGHGINRKNKSNHILNIFKRFYSLQADWWFAYTKGVSDLIINFGFPRNKITIVQNTYDALIFDKVYYKYDNKVIKNIYINKRINKIKIGLFCGSLSKEKNLLFLIKSCEIVKENIPNFILMIIGSGKYDKEVIKYTLKNNWIYYFGAKYNYSKVIYFKISDILLIPDAVGLVIIDSFVFKTPLITTTGKSHGPEIEYLENGKNGLMVDYNINSYSLNIINILNNNNYINKLKRGCKKSASLYTSDKMIDNFYNGIKSCLEI